MAQRELIPHKLVVEYDSQGKVKTGVLLYRVKVDGVLDRKFKSISIGGSGFSVPQFNAILGKIKAHAMRAENL